MAIEEAAPSSAKEKDAAIAAAIRDIDKSIGPKSIIRMGDAVRRDIPVIPTGILPLDNHVLGVGGFPRGRIVELYGPEGSSKTTLALSLIASAQARGGRVAFVDAEHALDPKWASTLGVDVDALLVSQPDTAENALQIVLRLVESKAIDVIVVDSVAALVPRAELEGEMGDAVMGAQARLMSQAMRKLVGPTAKSGTVLVFINQIREKLGVMFGCLHADELVHFTDGRRIPISKVVREHIPGDVLTVDESNAVVSRPITGWHANGKLYNGEQWVTLTTTAAGARNGTIAVCLTPDHAVYYADGTEVPAKDVRVGDKLLTYADRGLLHCPTVRSIVTGSLLGDGCLRLRTTSTAALQLANSQQPQYLQWKLSMLASLGFRSNGSTFRECFMSAYSNELAELRERFYIPLGLRKLFRSIPDNLVLDTMSVAVWFMDDGTCYKRKDQKKDGWRAHLSVKRLAGVPEQVHRAVAALNSWFGSEVFYVGTNNAVIILDSSAINAFAEKISSCVPECMQYKLPPEYRGRYVAPPLKPVTPSRVPAPVTVRGVVIGSPRKMRQLDKFDISVAGTSRYYAGGHLAGLLVHNSPEVTSGGRGLKFAASVRLDVRRKEAIKDGEETVGFRTKIKAVKNKVAAPFKEAEVELYFASGFDRVGPLVDAAVVAGVLDKSGSWYAYKGERIGQGRASVIKFLTGHDLFNKIKTELESKLAQEKA